CLEFLRRGAVGRRCPCCLPDTGPAPGRAPLWAATAITLRGGRSGDVVRRLGAVWPDTPTSAPRCATCTCPRVAQPDHPDARAAAAAGRERGELAPLPRKTRIIPTRKVRPHRDSNFSPPPSGGVASLGDAVDTAVQACTGI